MQNKFWLKKSQIVDIINKTDSEFSQLQFLYICDIII